MHPSPSLLRAFRHPLILLSIALLLLNDHLFKSLAPSWATGKISDFAGLFFFPFLVGVIIQAIRPKNIPSQTALLTGFTLSSAVFVGIKTLPALNGWAIGLLSSVYGQPARIVLDPSDCIALAVFLPAWILWTGIQRQKETPALGKIPYLALVAGSLAALASTPCGLIAYQVTRLALEEGTLYAGIGYPNRIEVGGYILASPQGWEDWHVVMYSEGSPEVVWRKVAQYEAIARNPFTEPRQLPYTACDPAEPRNCFRIDGRPQVDESLDGGASWKTAWLALTTREDFRRRLADQECSTYGKTPDLQTFDLVFVPGQNGATLIVAMGNEGLLVHPAQGGWQAVGISTSRNDTGWIPDILPTPFAARTPGEAINIISSEFLLALSAGLITWFTLSIWMRRAILQRTETFTNKQVKELTLPAKIALGWTLLIPASVLFFPGSTWNPLHSQLGSPFWLVLVILITWELFDLSIDLPRALRKLKWWVVFLGLLVFLTAWLPMVLWAFGVVERYALALTLSIGFGLAALVGGILWLHRRVKLAVEDIANQPG